jgi:uncharacterized membrane protein YkoI
MNSLMACVAASLVLISASGIASARDVADEEAIELQASGYIQSLEKLKSIALIAHPGATITDTDLDEAYGKHVFQMELTDTKGIEWNMDVDASTGKILKDHQDR